MNNNTQDVSIAIRFDASEFKTKGQPAVDRFVSHSESQLKRLGVQLREINAQLQKHEQLVERGNAKRLAQQEAQARRLELVQARSSARLEEITRRSEAAKDLARERFHLREVTRLKKLEAQAQLSAQNTASSAIAFSRSAVLAVVAVTVAAAAGIAKLGKESLDSFKEQDRLINVLRSSEETLDNAKRKYSELFQEGQKLVGLTGRDLVESYAFLKLSLDGSAESSEKLAKSFGKVKAIFNDFDPRKASFNISQLIKEKVQITDLRELETQVPGATRGLFSEFGVKNVEQLRKELTKLNPTISELQERFAKVFDKLGAQTDNFKTRIAKIGAQFQESLVPFGAFLGSIGLQIINQLSPAFSDFGSRVGGFFSKIAPNFRAALTVAVEFFAEVLRGLNSLEERFGIFDKAASVVNRFFELTLLLNSGFTSVAQTIRTVLGGAIDWLRGSLSSFLGSLASAFEATAGFLPDSFGGDKSRGMVKMLREAQINAISFGGRNIPIPSSPYSSPTGGDDPRYNDFGGAGKSDKKNKAQKDAETRQNLIESGRQSRERLTRELNERDDAAFREARMSSQRLSRVSATVSADALVDERMSSQRLSRAALTQDYEEREKIIEKQREALEKLKPTLSNTQRFMQGLRGEADLLGQSFERFGDSIGRAFGDVRNLLSGLGSAVKQFFGDLLSATLRNVAASALAPILGRVPQLAGAGSNSFLTGGFAGGSGAAGILSGSSGLLSNLFGSGSSITTLSQQAQQRNSLLPFLNNSSITSLAQQANSIAAGGKVGFLSGLKSSFASALPFLGLSAGSSLGGRSTAGQILSGVGGTLGGLVGASILGIGGSIGKAFALSGALGPAALVAAPLLIAGGILLGRAKQRREDESLADSYWVAYKDRLISLTRDVRANRLDGDDALVEATRARQEAIDQISQIKTKSVRESRLKNQIGDVDRSFLEPLKRAVAEQKGRRSLDNSLVPEFATGGYVGGRIGEARHIIAHAGELVINRNQQTPGLVREAEAAGVPGVKGSSGGSNQPNIVVQYIIGTKEQSQIVVNGISSDAARKPLADHINKLSGLGYI
jgi:hypothetical protein